MSQTDRRIFIGAELNPTLGEWLDLDNYYSEEEFLDAVGALRDRIKAAGHEESGVMDHEGFEGLMRGGSTYERAWVIHEVIEELDDKEAEALSSWMEHRGVDYTLFANGKLRGSNEIIDDFREDYIGTYESKEKFAEEKFAEHWDQLFASLDKHAKTPWEGIQTLVFGHMDWASLAYDYECGNTYFGTRDSSGVPVFWRN